MKFYFVTVTIHNSSLAEGELNQFLGSHRVIAVDRQFVYDGARSAWAIYVTYVPGDAGTTVEASKKPRLIDACGAGRTGSKRVIHGGFWSKKAYNVRAAYRNGNHPGNRNDNLGFRLAGA